MIVSGPPTDVPAASFDGGGPFWSNVRGLSSTHALGNQGGIITTADGGVTWTRQNASWCNASIGCTAKTSEGVDAAEVCAGPCRHGAVEPRAPSPSRGLHAQGGFHDLGYLNVTEGTPSNLTGLRSLSSTRYFLDARGAFAWEAKPGVRISGLPHLRMLGFSGDSLRLPDGSLLLVAKSILGTGPGRLSCVAIRSEDGGFTWRFASVVAAASEVPYAVEGPSEASLALLANGTLLAVMRVEGQSGHCAPYVSKLSDDGGPAG